MQKPNTICANCKFHMFEHHFSGKSLWYNQYCLASPIVKIIDPVTGEEKSSISGHESGYAYCRDINRGNCSLYVRQEDDVADSYFEEARDANKKTAEG